MRTRRSRGCRVAIVQSDLPEDDLERLKELSQKYPESYVEIYADEGEVSEDVICRISIFCEISYKCPETPPFVSFGEREYVVIVEKKDVEEFVVTSEKPCENAEILFDELHEILEKVTADPDSEQERSIDSEERASPTIRNRKSESASFSAPETDETVVLEKAPGTMNGEQKSRDIHLIVVLVTAAILIPALCLLAGEESSMKSLPEAYQEELAQLKAAHRKQDPRFWRVVNATMKSHIFDEDPPQPAVLMVASLSQTSATREKLAQDIARIYSMRCNGTDFMKIDGASYSSFDHSTAKERLDTEIHAGFAAGSCAVIVSNFEDLPPASTTVFYQFCENDYAPYKKVLILFTTEISNWDWMKKDQTRLLSEDGAPKPQFWSRVVESFLKFSLQRNDKSGMMTVDMVGGLLTRITPLVAWVGSE